MVNQQELIKEISKKYKVDVTEVKRAINSQFHFTEEKMKDFHTIRLPYFGVFKPNLRKKQKIDENNKQ